MLSALRRLVKRLRKRRPSIRDRFAVGRGTYGEPRVLHWGEPATLRVGAFCSIGKNVTIFLGGEHRTDWLTTYPFMCFYPSARHLTGLPVSKGDVVIGHDVWVGYGATVLSGVTVGNGAVIGANALVVKDVPAYGIVGGNPAKLLRKRFSDETIRLLERLAWWDWPDAHLEQVMPLLMSADLPGLIEYARLNFDARAA